MLSVSSANLFRLKYLLLASIGLLSAVLVSCGSGNQVTGGTTETAFVAVTQIVKHPFWNAVRDGIKDSLAEAGYKDGETLRWEWRSAKGNPATAAQIAKKYARANPDVIIAIAPLSAQTIVASVKTTPVIFSAVADPVSANLVRDARRPDGNVTGVSDLSPIEQQLALIQEILPEASVLGILYGAEEEDSIKLVDLGKALALAQGFTEVKEAIVSEPVEAANIARSLVGTVDAIYVPADSTVTPALASVVQVGRDNDMPIFAGDVSGVERGAIASIGFNYYDIGRQTGDMVSKVLQGSRPSDLPVEYINVVQLAVNPASAAEMGVTLPETVIERADRIVR